MYIGHLSPYSENFIFQLHRPLGLTDTNPSVKLFSRNDLVDDYNRKCILDFPGPLFEFKSSDQGDAKNLNEIPAPRILWLKQKCPVILLRNLSNKLVNGLQGYVLELPGCRSDPVIDFPSVNTRATISKVKFTGSHCVFN